MVTKQTSLDMVELSGEDVYPDWENLLKNNTENKDGKNTAKSELDISLDMLLDEKKDINYWQDLFNQMNFPGMDLMAVNKDNNYVLDPLEEHKIFQEKIVQFLKLLATENVNDLRTAGISESSIFAMEKGLAPVNWTVHLKYPLAYTGRVDFDNMVLIQIQPFHEDIHQFINKQILSKAGVARPEELYIPVPSGRVYIPMSGSFGGAGGGKAAAQISSNSGNANGGR